MKRKSPARSNRTRKKSSPKKRGQKPPFLQMNGFKILYYFFLLCLFIFTMGLTGYVIFFRTVTAAELPFEESDITSYVPEPNGYINGSKPKVAVIIDDLGYHYQIGRDLLALELDLSFSFLPHAPYTRPLESEAYQKGRTILLHQPLEPRGSEWDPGPGALFTSGSMDEYRYQLEANLQAVPHATGINNHMGSKFTEDSRAMGQLLQLIKEKELYFIDSYTSSTSIGMMMAKDYQVATARRHVFLDNLQQQDHICRQLNSLANLAYKQGWAIGIGHPYAETYEALKNCGETTLSSVDLVGVDKLVD
ncbi:MAG: divergent polysaccharide deacetylase family protein [Desulfobulbaceae bacterium]|nr:MAG: divergent polysaccharide deacetylase family protein [Desulfobulbaceae bacterium]